MILSDRTIQILKNFSTINQSIAFFEGSELKTQNPQKNMFVKAKIAETFPSSVGIFDLSQLLSSISLIKDADLEFTKKHLSIKGKDMMVNYMYSPLNMLKSIPDKDKSLYASDFTTTCEFKLTQNDFNSIMKAMGVLQVPDIVFRASGGQLKVVVTSLKNPTSNSFELHITETDEVFEFCFQGELLKFVPGDYKVKLLNKSIGHFSCDDIEYFVGVRT